MLARKTASCKRTVLAGRAEAALFPLWILKYLPNMVATHISLALKVQGPNSTVTTACVAGTQAIGRRSGSSPTATPRWCWPAVPIAGSTRS